MATLHQRVGPPGHASTLSRPVAGETWAPTGHATVLNYTDGRGYSESLVSVQDLTYAEHATTSVTVIFLSTVKSRAPGNEELRNRLITEFDVPPWFWSAKVQNSSGYFYGHDGTNGVTTVFHFLIKHITGHDSSPASHEPYGWHIPSFVTTWQSTRKTTLLCFDLPLEAQEFLRLALASVSINSLASHPFAIQSLVLDHIVNLHDAAIWSFRNLVRQQEQSRPTLQHSNPDYARLHDLARHIMHASEVSETALHVIDSMLQEVSAYDAKRTARPASNTDVAADIRRHRSLLQCINRRSQALEERLRNEINLAFHIASEHDSLVQAQIASAANMDSRAMKTISILGMVFLPGTFVSALFSMSFFSFTPASTTDGTPASWNMSDKFWIYWVVAVPVTALTISVWYYWQRNLVPQVPHVSSRAVEVLNDPGSFATWW